MSTVALECVPPNVQNGVKNAHAEGRKIKQLLAKYDLADKINSLVIPGIIEEDPDRPIVLNKKMDPLDTWKVLRTHLPHLQCTVTQVTAFLSEEQLTARFSALREADVNRVVCVGVPRTMQDGEGHGVAPTDALLKFRHIISSTGVILIPTRKDETGRFKYKIDRGADFAMTQLLYSDQIVRFLREMKNQTDRRPEILLSFGHVPGAETRRGLIQWLIKDEGNPLVEREMAFVSHLAAMEPDEKQTKLADLYKRVIDGVQDLGFPIGLHLECPYGVSDPAFSTFASLLEVWSPVTENVSPLSGT